MASSFDSSLTRRSLLAGASAAVAAPFASRLDALAQSDLEDRVGTILKGMTLGEKVGQLFIFQAVGNGMSKWFETHLKELKPGGVLFEAPNFGPANTVGPFVSAIHGTNPDIPPLIALDQEGGPVSRLAGDPAPGAIELAKKDDTTVRKLARERGEFLNSFGFDINFAPVADVAYAANSSMIDRSFGNDPHEVARKVAAIVSGSRHGRIAGAVKHFPGHGRAVEDSHVTLPKIDISFNDWMKSDALPFKYAVDQKVEMVMVGHLLFPQWDDQPTSISKAAVNVLRSKLGYKGVIVTDDLGMGALAGRDPFDIQDQAVDAGVDAFVWVTCTAPQSDLVRHLIHRVEKGKIPEKRIDASVKRMLRIKVQRFSL
jgi:beta-N-acetylhexosaminidase